MMTLARYGVKNIYGCRGGYKGHAVWNRILNLRRGCTRLIARFGGMVQPDTWMTLTPDVVQDIHKDWRVIGRKV